MPTKNTYIVGIVERWVRYVSVKARSGAEARRIVDSGACDDGDRQLLDAQEPKEWTVDKDEG